MTPQHLALWSGRIGVDRRDGFVPAPPRKMPTPTGRRGGSCNLTDDAVTPGTEQAPRTRTAITRIRAVAPRWTPEERSEIRELRGLEGRAAADAAVQAACRLQRAQRRRVIRELGELAELAQRLHAALLLQAHFRHRRAAAAEERLRRDTLTRVLRIQCCVRARFAVAGASSAPLTAYPRLGAALAPRLLSAPAAAHSSSAPASPRVSQPFSQDVGPPGTLPPKLASEYYALFLDAACRRLRQNRALHEEMYQFAALRLRMICSLVRSLPPARLG